MSDKFFGENAEFDDHERDEAKQYLESWKKFLLRRLKKDSYDVVVKDEIWGEIPGHFRGCIAPRNIMYLKLYIQADWHYELGRH